MRRVRYIATCRARAMFCCRRSPLMSCGFTCMASATTFDDGLHVRLVAADHQDVLQHVLRELDRQGGAVRLANADRRISEPSSSRTLLRMCVPRKRATSSGKAMWSVAAFF